jgi:hypothetical protein
MLTQHLVHALDASGSCCAKNRCRWQAIGWRSRCLGLSRAGSGSRVGRHGRVGDWKGRTASTCAESRGGRRPPWGRSTCPPSPSKTDSGTTPCDPASEPSPCHADTFGASRQSSARPRLTRARGTTAADRTRARAHAAARRVPALDVLALDRSLGCVIDLHEAHPIRRRMALRRRRTGSSSGGRGLRLVWPPTRRSGRRT